MHGATNDYLVFAIVDIIRKEISRMIDTGSVDFTGGGNSYTSVNQTNGSTYIIYKQALEALNSNDYTLELLKNDESNPNQLTGVKITYNEKIYSLLTLIRLNGKLSQVKDSLIIVEDHGEPNNPYGMSNDDFTAYVVNKGIIEDPGATQEAFDTAAAENLALRQKYNVADLYVYADILPFIEGMVHDYVEKVILQVLISLNYNVDGKMTGVTSQTLAPEV